MEQQSQCVRAAGHRALLKLTHVVTQFTWLMWPAARLAAHPPPFHPPVPSPAQEWVTFCFIVKDTSLSCRTFVSWL